MFAEFLLMILERKFALLEPKVLMPMATQTARMTLTMILLISRLLGRKP